MSGSFGMFPDETDVFCDDLDVTGGTGRLWKKMDGSG